MSDRSPEIDCNHDNTNEFVCEDCGRLVCSFCSADFYKNDGNILKAHLLKEHPDEYSNNPE